MRYWIHKISVLFFLSPVVVLLLAQAALAEDFEATEIASGVYQFRWVGHNAMFVTSGDEVVVFDTINSEAAAQLGREILRVLPGAQLTAIVYSHSDADHSTGAPALMESFGLDSVPIIAHELAVGPIRKGSNPAQPEPT
ncbi:MAG: MBL fold metallo-hydrolase, partial [Gammaproteobacteria bacterium]